MNVEILHTCGYCNDENEGNLRIQIHISIDRKSAPLLTIIRQEHMTDNSHEKTLKK